MTARPAAPMGTGLRSRNGMLIWHLAAVAPPRLAQLDRRARRDLDRCR